MMSPQITTRTILIVEDFLDSRQLMRTLLEINGYRVIEAEDGQQAVEVARREHPDLILMDLSLPVLDGLSSTRFIRKIDSMETVPIIAVTAHSRDGIEADARQAGCTDYLPKPIDMAKLKKMLSAYAPLK
jgi:two-component system, cell cycle response regulator DivK